MNANLDLKQTEKASFQLAAYADGTSDISLGLVFVLLGFYPLTRTFLGPILNMVVFLAALAAIVISLQVLRSRITPTRIGLVQFGLLLAAGDALRSAGRAAVQEAAMPEATCRSIAAAARRRLAAAHLANVVDPVRVEINGRPRFGATRPESGDRVVVTLTLATPAAAPDLLGPLGISLAGRQIQFGLAVHIP